MIYTTKARSNKVSCSLASIQRPGHLTENCRIVSIIECEGLIKTIEGTGTSLRVLRSSDAKGRLKVLNSSQGLARCPRLPLKTHKRLIVYLVGTLIIISPSFGTNGVVMLSLCIKLMQCFILMLQLPVNG